MQTTHDHVPQLPTIAERLPALTPEERRKVSRSCRLVKAGRLYEVRFTLHEKEECLAMQWTDDGAGKLCK